MCRKKYGNTLDKIGERRYEFDYQLEKNIYSYLCRYQRKKKNVYKLDTKLKFNTYQEWKKYICEKYSSYSQEELVEFSRFLNQKIRISSPTMTCYNLYIPICASFFIGYITDNLVTMKLDLSDLSFLGALIYIFIWTLIFIAIILGIAMLLFPTIFEPIWNHDMDKNMFIDYKEIIDEMLNTEKESFNHTAREG